ncbi:MAG: hypothetical protein H6562_24270 [Lewinellaceae bacterium]|nr:hypothetical protein [Lewinella sp.]MCB9282027.1 hypothetical protein [Lewinellaceae bacterium]
MKKWMIMLVCLFGATLAQAQFFDDPEPAESQGPIMERVRAQRIAFITDQMKLTPSESERFWPVMREFENKEAAVRKKYRLTRRIDDLTDAEAEEALNNRLKMEEELLTLKREYAGKLLDVLPGRKLILYHKADLEFKRMILERAGQLRRNNRNGFKNN